MSHVTRSLGVLAVLLCEVASTVPARAQTWSVPLGGRSAMMGASVAEGHDLAAPLLNPAGIAAVDVQVFGLTSAIYAYQRENIPRYFTPNGFHSSFGEVSYDDDGLRASGIEVIPSGAGAFRHFGRAKTDEAGHLVLGLTILSPLERTITATGRSTAQLTDVNGSLERSTAVTENLLDLYFGPVAALVLSKRVRIGVSLFGLYRRRYLQSESSLSETSSGGNDLGLFRETAFVDARSIGATAVAGVQLQPIDDVWLGLSVQAPSMQLQGKETQGRNQVLFISTTSSRFGTFVVSDTRNRDLSYTSKEPLRISAGLAYVKPRAFGIAGDVAFRPATPGIDVASGSSVATRSITGSATRTSDEDYTRSIDGKATFDFAAGVELYVTRALALRAGWSQATDYRILPPLGRETVNMTRRDLRTISAGLGLVIGPFDTTFGLSWQHITGTMDALDTVGAQPAADSSYPQFARLPLSGDALLFNISATVSEEEARQKLLQRVQGAVGVDVGGTVSIALGASTCPRDLDATAIAAFDYSTLVEGRVDDARAIKAGLVALADVATLTDRVSLDLREACVALASDLTAKPAAAADATTACSAAADAIAIERAKLGPAAQLAVTLVPAVCTVQMAPLESCLATCDGSASATASASARCDAKTTSTSAKGTCSVDMLAIASGNTCALRCEARARAKATCTAAGIGVTITGATDEAAAAKLSAALTARLPAVSRALAFAAGKSGDLGARVADVLGAVRASVDAVVKDAPTASAGLAACVTGPAADFAARIDRFGGAIAAAGDVVSRTK